MFDRNPFLFITISLPTAIFLVAVAASRFETRHIALFKLNCFD
jgi:hypothetical protein